MEAAQRDSYIPVKNQFFILHQEIFEKLLSEASPQAFRLYYLLRSYSNASYKPVFPRTKTLAQRMQVSVDSISNYLKELETIGFIVIQRIPGKTNTYHFAVDISTTESTTTRSLSDTPRITQSVSERLPIDPPKLFGYNNQIHLKPNSNLTTTITTTNHRVDDDVLEKSTMDSHSKVSGQVATFQDTKSQMPLSLSATPPIQPNQLRLMGIDPESGVGEFLLFYLDWFFRKSKVSQKIINPVGFIRWMIKTIDTYDFSEYLAYLEHKVKQQQTESTTQKMPATPKMLAEEIQDVSSDDKKRTVEHLQRTNPGTYTTLLSAVYETLQTKYTFFKPDSVLFSSIVIDELCQHISAVPKKMVG